MLKYTRKQDTVDLHGAGRALDRERKALKTENMEWPEFNKQVFRYLNRRATYLKIEKNRKRAANNARLSSAMFKTHLVMTVDEYQLINGDDL